MHDELTALHGTWTLVPRNSSLHVIGSKWVFKTKLKADGSLDRYKARLVAKGYNQIKGVDFYNTFSPVIKPTSIRLVLTLVVQSHWHIRQLDVKNAFLHENLKEVVYMRQPPRFSHPQYLDHVCLLHKAISGLKQAPQAWFDRLSSYLLCNGFHCSRADSSLFIRRCSQGILIFLIYLMIYW